MEEGLGEVYFISAKTSEAAAQVAVKLGAHPSTVSIAVNKCSVTWTVKQTGLEPLVDQMIKDRFIDAYTSSAMFYTIK